MLEENFSELDNDFITLWSRYYINQDFSAKEDIKRLAELGQVNAIQEFYALSDEFETNERIEKNLNKLNKYSNFNHGLAWSNYYKNQEIASFEELYKEYQNNPIKFIDKNCSINDIYKHLDHNSLYDKINRLNYVVCLNEAILESKYKFMFTRNPLYLESMLEMKLQLPIFTNEINTTINVQNRCCRDLLKKHIKLYPDNNAIKFALAKNFVLFDARKREKREGIETLKSFSQRELSSTYKKYVARVTKKESNKNEEANEKNN